MSATTTLVLNGRTLRVKVLTSERDKQRGYQFAKVAPQPNQGLLFVFTEPGAQSFHMKNVPFDLELLAFNGSGIFLGSLMMSGTSKVDHRSPKSYRTHPDTLYVVEVSPEGSWGSSLHPGVSRMGMLARDI